MTLNVNEEKTPLVQTGFAPVVSASTHTLILGSFPGEASLRAQQYYAFAYNQFWPLMSGVIGIDLRVLSYDERLHALQQNSVGLWDIYQACVRIGSLDSAIRQGQINDFTELRQRYPMLRKLCFNGQTAGKMQPYFATVGFQTLQLPSSSPAQAKMRIDDKLKIWRQIVA